MHPTLVCFSTLTLTLALTAAGPLSAQPIDTRFTDLDAPGAAPGVLPTAELGRIPPGLRQAADSTSETSGSPFWGMAIASTIGGGTGVFLGWLAGGAVGDELSTPFLTGAVGTTVGASLAVAIAGSDHGVRPIEALFSGVSGFGAGIATAALLNDRTSGALLVPGFVMAQGLTAATVGWLFAD